MLNFCTSETAFSIWLDKDGACNVRIHAIIKWKLYPSVGVNKSYWNNLFNIKQAWRFVKSAEYCKSKWCKDSLRVHDDVFKKTMKSF